MIRAVAAVGAILYLIATTALPTVAVAVATLLRTVRTTPQTAVTAALKLRVSFPPYMRGAQSSR